MTSGATRWWWVRHAPVIDLEGILYGSDDVSCETNNILAFESLASLLPKDAYWMMSHLVRTHQTADAIRKAGLNFPEPVVEEALGEQSFGDWQGLSWKKLEQLDQYKFDNFWLSPARNRPPNGESFQDLITRVSLTINRVNNDFSGRTIVAVAHGGTIRAAISYALNLPAEIGMSFIIDNLSMTCLDYIDGGLLMGKGSAWRVVCINRLPLELK